MSKGFHSCAYPGECPLKDAEQNFSKKPVFTLVFKLKTLVIRIEIDLGGDIKSNCMLFMS